MKLDIFHMFATVSDGDYLLCYRHDPQRRSHLGAPSYFYDDANVSDNTPFEAKSSISASLSLGYSYNPGDSLVSPFSFLKMSSWSFRKWSCGKSHALNLSKILAGSNTPVKMLDEHLKRIFIRRDTLKLPTMMNKKCASF